MPQSDVPLMKQIDALQGRADNARRIEPVIAGGDGTAVDRGLAGTSQGLR